MHNKCKPLLYVKLIYQYIYSYRRPQMARFISNEECVRRIVEDKKSFIRFGDGECDIMEGKDIHYQEYSKELACSLNEIIATYIKSDSLAMVVGMPSLYINRNGLYMLKFRKLMSCWTHTRYWFKKNYDCNCEYGDAHLFIKDNEWLYSKIWRNEHVDYVIFVHNSRGCALEFEKKYGIKTKWIEIPPKNAFQECDKIYNDIVSNVENKEETMILISAGPCGKVLAFELAMSQYWVVDTGHCWDEALVIDKEVMDNK